MICPEISSQGTLLFIIQIQIVVSDHFNLHTAVAASSP